MASLPPLSWQSFIEYTFSLQKSRPFGFDIPLLGHKVPFQQGRQLQIRLPPFVSDRMEFLPAAFPAELGDAAFVKGNEAAWPPAVAAQVVEWLGLHGYAVLGTELWVIRNGAIHSLPIGQSALPEVHGNVVNRRPHELWADFVSRAASETVGYLRSFSPSEIVEPGDPFFNVTWVNEQDFQKLGS